MEQLNTLPSLCAMDTGHELFIQTRPTRLFFKAAVPGMVGMVFSNIYFVIEMILIGQVAGAEAFAAANLAMPFILINFALSDMVGVGSSVRISIRLGEGRKEEADKIFSQAVVSGMLLAAISAAVLLLCCPPVFRLMGADDELVSLAMLYMTPYAILSPLSGQGFAFDNYQRICGRPKRAMWINILMSVLSLSLQFLFLFVLDLGLPGASLATSLGITITTLIAAAPFIRGRYGLRFTRFRPSWALFGDVAANGMPGFLNNISGKVTSVLMNFLLLRMGGAAAVSVYGVLMNIDGVVFSAMYGLCDSLQPAIGYNWGAGEKGRASALGKRCALSAAIVCVIAFVLSQLFPEWLHAIFLGRGGETEAMAVHAIRVFALVYLTRWAAHSTQSFCSAIGFAGPATLLSVGSALVFPLASIVLLSPLGLEGLWLVMPAASALASILALAILLTRVRKGLR